MRTFGRRLNKLEQEFGVGSQRIVLVLCQAAIELALDSRACVQILDEAGFLSPSGCVLVVLGNIPDGLSAEETERYLRENGDQICPGHPKNENRSVYDRRD